MPLLRVSHFNLSMSAVLLSDRDHSGVWKLALCAVSEIWLSGKASRRISQSCPPPPDSPRWCPLSPSTAFCWLWRPPVVLKGPPRGYQQLHYPYETIIHWYGREWETARGHGGWAGSGKGIIIIFLHLSPHLGFLTTTLLIPAWLNHATQAGLECWTFWCTSLEKYLFPMNFSTLCHVPTTDFNVFFWILYIKSTQISE